MTALGGWSVSGSPRSRDIPNLGPRPKRFSRVGGARDTCKAHSTKRAPAGGGARQSTSTAESLNGARQSYPPLPLSSMSSRRARPDMRCAENRDASWSRRLKVLLW